MGGVTTAERERLRDVHDVQKGTIHMAMQLLMFLNASVTPTGQKCHCVLFTCSESVSFIKDESYFILKTDNLMIPNRKKKFSFFLLLFRFCPSSCTPSSEVSSTLQSEASMLLCKCVTCSKSNGRTMRHNSIEYTIYYIYYMAISMWTHKQQGFAPIQPQ